MTIWICLLPFAILYRLVDVSAADILLSVYILYFSIYMLGLAVGFLVFGLRIYFSFVRSVGIGNLRYYLPYRDFKLKLIF